MKPDARNAVTTIPIITIGVPWPMRQSAAALQLIMRLKTNADENRMKCIGRVVKLRATGGYKEQMPTIAT